MFAKVRTNITYSKPLPVKERYTKFQTPQKSHTRPLCVYLRIRTRKLLVKRNWWFHKYSLVVKWKWWFHKYSVSHPSSLSSPVLEIKSKKGLILLFEMEGVAFIWYWLLRSGKLFSSLIFSQSVQLDPRKWARLSQSLTLIISQTCGGERSNYTKPCFFARGKHLNLEEPSNPNRSTYSWIEVHGYISSTTTRKW